MCDCSGISAETMRFRVPWWPHMTEAQTAARESYADANAESLAAESALHLFIRMNAVVPVADRLNEACRNFDRAMQRRHSALEAFKIAVLGDGA